MTGKGLRKRFWLETALAIISGVLVIGTLLWRDWIEIVFGIDPDEGSGSLEVAITAFFVLLTIAMAVLARIEWRRPRSTAATPG